MPLLCLPESFYLRIEKRASEAHDRYLEDLQERKDHVLILDDDFTDAEAFYGSKSPSAIMTFINQWCPLVPSAPMRPPPDTRPAPPPMMDLHGHIHADTHTVSRGRTWDEHGTGTHRRVRAAPSTHPRRWGKIAKMKPAAPSTHPPSVPTSTAMDTDGTSGYLIDSDGDYSNVTQSSVTYDTGISLEAFAADASVSLTGILVGDIDDSYSGLIA